ncbi:peptide-binding protein [Nostoc sp. CENA543]|uniref:FHA domain-containing protein n=1 Tax=Nostoc sp. CENA543 TaxID=1869241 RepID=UPI000CA371DB|nr:FHA domain-containing protein [Nostoc sp. CENA543]AUT04128.1 peptide-binding protein [Nostoc sp. CENA543]
MNALTLQWYDAGQNHTKQIYEQQPSKKPGTIRIGRDQSQCDIVLVPGTVSRLHVEIFFNSQQQSFYIRNLQPNNPPLVDGQQLIQGERPINQGSVIHLGQVQLQVVAVNINSMPATIINPVQPTSPPAQPQQPAYQNRQVTPLGQPQPPAYQNKQVTPLGQPQQPVYQNRQVTPLGQPQPPANQQFTPPVHNHPPVQGSYGLECPKCHKVSPVENLQVGCPWCGTSLAAAVSVLVAPGN